MGASSAQLYRVDATAHLPGRPPINDANRFRAGFNAERIPEVTAATRLRRLPITRPLATDGSSDGRFCRPKLSSIVQHPGIGIRKVLNNLTLVLSEIPPKALRRHGPAPINGRRQQNKLPGRYNLSTQPNAMKSLGTAKPAGDTATRGQRGHANNSVTGF
jgi:hypothetical protein